MGSLAPACSSHAPVLVGMRPKASTANQGEGNDNHDPSEEGGAAALALSVPRETCFCCLRTSLRSCQEQFSLLVSSETRASPLPPGQTVPRSGVGLGVQLLPSQKHQISVWGSQCGLCPSTTEEDRALIKMSMCVRNRRLMVPGAG